MLDGAPAQPVTTPAPTVEVPWGVGIALAALVISVGAEIVGDILVAVAISLSGHDARTTLESIAGQIAVYQFLLLGIAISVVTLILQRFRATPAILGYTFPGWPVLGTAAVVAMVVVVVGVEVIYQIFNSFFPAFHIHGNTQQFIQATPGHLGIPAKIGIFLFFAVEAPLAEETLFRGIIFQGLRNFFGRLLPHHWAVFLGAMTSGALFGLVHFEPHTLPILTFLGIVLAYVYQYTRSIYGSALIHGMVNAVAALSLLGSH